MVEEIWKEIEQNTKYSVSTLGRIRNNKTGRILKNRRFKKDWYSIFDISEGGIAKTVSVHRKVANAFIPNPENKPHINHINGIKNDNRVENLEWCTQQENVDHAIKTGLMKMGADSPFCKLDVIQVRTIKKCLLDGVKGIHISKYFKISNAKVSYIKNGHNWANV